MTAKTAKAAVATRRRLFILDDHPMTRFGMAQLIGLQEDLILCGEAENANQALKALESCKADLVLVDIELPGKSGLEFIKDMRALHPEVAMLVVSMHDETVYAERALRAGASGYLMKNAGGKQLLAAIRQVLQGRAYVSESISAKILEGFAPRRSNSNVTTLRMLTDREFEIFELLGQTFSTREIGERLHISAKTVETHRIHIKEKFKLKTEAELVRYAVRWAATQQLA